MGARACAGRQGNACRSPGEACLGDGGLDGDGVGGEEAGKDSEGGERDGADDVAGEGNDPRLGELRHRRAALEHRRRDERGVAREELRASHENHDEAEGQPEEARDDGLQAGVCAGDAGAAAADAHHEQRAKADVHAREDAQQEDLHAEGRCLAWSPCTSHAVQASTHPRSLELIWSWFAWAGAVNSRNLWSERVHVDAMVVAKVLGR